MPKVNDPRRAEETEREQKERDDLLAALVRRLQQESENVAPRPQVTRTTPGREPKGWGEGRLIGADVRLVLPGPCLSCFGDVTGWPVVPVETMPTDWRRQAVTVYNILRDAIGDLRGGFQS